MPVHDWTRVSDGEFHDFHNSWAFCIKNGLNNGGLPPGYYAQTEQHFNRRIGDVLTLREQPLSRPPAVPPGTLAVADAPPKVQITRTLHPTARTRRRTVAVRRVGSDDVVALIEVVSPANKDRPESAAEFVGKVTGSLRAGVHVAVVDLLPPGRHCPGGWDPAVTADFGVPQPDDAAQPADRPAAFLSYEARLPDVEAYIDYLPVGDPVPDLPLFLATGYYVDLPLGRTYEATVRALPRITRAELDAPPAG